MQILLFVMTLLMLLSMITYAKMQSFLFSERFHHQVYQAIYIKDNSRHAINAAADRLYEQLKATQKGSSDDDQKRTKVLASTEVSLYLLFHKEKRQDKQLAWQQTRVLLENLLRSLYEKEPFFQELIKEHSDGIATMAASLIHAVDEILDCQSEAKGQRSLKKAQDLANVTLADPALDMALYKMLQEGDRCLLNFVNVSPHTPLRVFLAPKEVLLAAFPPHIVSEILTERKALYRQAKNGQDVAELSESFKSQFEGHRYQEIDPSSLNFAVTKTQPCNS